MFDEYQLHCIPGDQQVYPEGFGLNEDPSSDEEVCRKSYLIINENRFDYILLTDKPGKVDRCADPSYLCEGEEQGKTLPQFIEYR